MLSSHDITVRFEICFSQFSVEKSIFDSFIVENTDNNVYNSWKMGIGFLVCSCKRRFRLGLQFTTLEMQFPNIFH